MIEGLKQANLNFPGGKITRRQQEYRLRTVGEFKEPVDISQVGLLQNEGKAPVFIRDVADVKDTFKEEQTVARLNGQPTLLLAIYKMADANTVDVVNRVMNRAFELNQEYQGRLQLIAVQDQGRYIQQAINQLQEAAVLGGILACVVLLGFLGDWRSALTVVTAIPISILATFGLMYLGGISLNMMSLGGLALGCGHVGGQRRGRSGEYPPSPGVGRLAARCHNQGHRRSEVGHYCFYPGSHHRFPPGYFCRWPGRATHVPTGPYHIILLACFPGGVPVF